MSEHIQTITIKGIRHDGTPETSQFIVTREEDSSFIIAHSIDDDVVFATFERIEDTALGLASVWAREERSKYRTHLTNYTHGVRPDAPSTDLQTIPPAIEAEPEPDDAGPTYHDAFQAFRRLMSRSGMAFHHINGDPNDNSEDNLVIVPISENRRKPR